MQQTALIPTLTQLTITGDGIAIKTFYQDPTMLPDTIVAAIAESVGIQDGTSFIEEELIIEMQNSPADLNYMLDSDGNLILMISTGDQDNYSIDSNGDLTYTTSE